MVINGISPWTPMQLAEKCCKVNRLHVPAHSAALLVLTRSSSALHQQGSHVVSQREHCPKCNDIHCCILCFGQVDLYIWISISLILLVLLAMGWRMGQVLLFRSQILGNVTHALSSCT